MSSISTTTSCQLVSGIFALGVQLLLAVLCITTLVIKRFQEYPRRDWVVWSLDASKQGMSSSMGHMTNIVLSIIIASSIKDKTSDECQWYCLAYISDCVFGTCFNFVLLMTFERILSATSPPLAEYLKFGVYGDPPSVLRWLPQVTIWMMIVLISKCLVLSVMVAFLYPLNAAGKVIFTNFHNYPKIELLTVMIVIPMIMNSVQFWVTDTFLKVNTGSQRPPGLRALPLDSSHNDIDEELLQMQTGSSGRRGRSSLSVTNGFLDDDSNPQAHERSSSVWPSTSPIAKTIPKLYSNVQPLSAAKEIAHGQMSWANAMFGHLQYHKRAQKKRSARSHQEFDRQDDDSESVYGDQDASL